MKKHYERIIDADLLDLLPVEDFRLIKEEHRKVSVGISEIPVAIDMKAAFAKHLAFKVPWDGELYGALKRKQKLFEKIGCDDVVRLTIIDWDERFTLVFENKQGEERPVYSVEKAYIKNLLEHCRKPSCLKE